MRATWGLRVPLDKLHSERFVPVDEETQHVVARMVELASLPRAVGQWRRAPTRVLGAQAFLLPRYWQPVICTEVHWSGRPPPATALLRDRDGTPRCQPAGAYAKKDQL